VLPLGLTNAHSVFQRLMNTVIKDLSNTFVMCYLDDILLFSKNAQDHMEHVLKSLRRLREHKLYAKMSKCEFNKTKVNFLGHVVGARGISMQERKVAAIHYWPTPTKLVELQAFLGLTNYYRRFIRNFSTLTAPMTDATR
jgi:Reverse transcriptase (RNA-dependent DNA polymerase)